MQNIVVVNAMKDWPLENQNCTIVPARRYLTDPEYAGLRNARVFNLCRSYRYQSLGYYVSLLAAARGHKPLPSVSTLLDVRNNSLVRFVNEDIDDLIQRGLKSIVSDTFTLSIYFGKNLAKRYDRLSMALYKLFPAPFLRAYFRREPAWKLVSIGPIPASEIPEEHRPFAMERIEQYFAGRRISTGPQRTARYDIAILFNPDDPTRPSDQRAVQRFINAAEELDMSAEIITKADYGRLASFDGLFIRETTGVNHHTYRFARKAVAEGLYVIDDPQSILLCTNKVFLAELLERHGIPTPKTLVVHEKNRAEVSSQLGLPVILKQPDSSFSLGVHKAENEERLQHQLDMLLQHSELVIAQEFLPTAFDWRIGILDRKPLYACKYHMAPHHWQIARHGATGKTTFGRVEAVPLSLVPKRVVQITTKAAGLIGEGLYGVDCKEINGRCTVIEVNENPNIDAGVEDSILRDDLYLAVMRQFLERCEQRSRPRSAN